MDFNIQKNDEGYIIVLRRMGPFGTLNNHPEEEFCKKLGITHKEYLEEAYKYGAYHRICPVKLVKTEKAYWILKDAANAFIEEYLSPKLLMLQLATWDKQNLLWRQL
jgi:hypothetical protein